MERNYLMFIRREISYFLTHFIRIFFLIRIIIKLTFELLLLFGEFYPLDNNCSFLISELHYLCIKT